MQRSIEVFRRRRFPRPPRLLRRLGLLLALLLVPASHAMALIMGGEGNSPVNDPGWPAGAAKVFNSPSRIAWWEGPPLGGGEWHAECRGNTAAFQEALEAFARIESEKKRLVIHDGEGASFWLNTNNDPDKKAAAVADWIFVIWQPESWKRIQAMPVDLRGPSKKGETGPVPQIDVYVGGRIIWSDVEVPKGIEVVDERLEAHGFDFADGSVLEGTIVELPGDKPVAAKVTLQKVEPNPAGGYAYDPARTVEADANGHWVFKKIPAGWFRIVAEAPGFAPRVAGYIRPTDEPRWQSLDTGLAKAASVSGKIVDPEGKPLAGVSVRLQGVSAGDNSSYETAAATEMTTDAAGQFRTDQIPAGKGRIWIHKEGYVRAGLGKEITLPAKDVELTMSKASLIKVSVDFGGVKAPQGYIVEIEPEGGSKVGSWGGSGNINDNAEIEFKNVPSGRYHLKGRPNPGSANQESPVETVDLKGGETVEVTIKAKR